MIQKIKLKNFRNHENYELNIAQPFVYFYGENGSGKTSILESIYFCATTKSFRTSDEKQVIQKDKPFAQVKIEAQKHQYEITISKNGKRSFIDGVEKRKLSEFVGHLSVVLFSPNDLDLIGGSPNNRRQFMDLEMLQIYKQYLITLNQYKKILKQRNSLLKKIKIDDDYTFLNILGEQLYTVGIELIQQRSVFIEEINQYLQDVYKKFSLHQIKIVYMPDVDEKQFKKHLEKQQRQDILYQATLAGPHKDDFFFDFNGFDAKNYASQGEQRLIVISLKLALLAWIENKTNRQVILCLDDVLSELDLDKQKILIDNLPKQHQILMNSTIPIENSQIQSIELKKEIAYVKL
ncbi:MAG: DNA replication/repair protein RecF [Acholeplasmataceae bacterium]